MKIAKFQPDEEGVIYLKKVTAAVWTGLQGDVPTMICIQADDNEFGKDITYYVKKVGDPVTMSEIRNQLLTTMVSEGLEYLVFNEQPQLRPSPQPSADTGPPIPGMTL